MLRARPHGVMVTAQERETAGLAPLVHSVMCVIQYTYILENKVVKAEALLRPMPARIRVEGRGTSTKLAIYSSTVPEKVP